MKIAVAMSVYKSDSYDYFKLAVNSILDQTYTNFDIYIEVDGFVQDDILKYLKLLNNEKNVFVSFNQDNKGLATRLNQVIDKAIESGTYKFVARMDADDISSPDRFQTQVDFLSRNPEISILGSDVLEFHNGSDTKFYKRMNASHDLLSKNIIKRCPFNHPSVMFRLDVFTQHKLRYKPELKNTQDYYLWVDALSCGLNFANINKPLLRFRVDENFHSRRGFEKAMNDFRSRLYAMKTLKIYSIRNLFLATSLLILRLSPQKFKKFAYAKFR